jgi:hypothetical protein
MARLDWRRINYWRLAFAEPAAIWPPKDTTRRNPAPKPKPDVLRRAKSGVDHLN